MRVALFLAVTQASPLKGKRGRAETGASKPPSGDSNASAAAATAATFVATSSKSPSTGAAAAAGGMDSNSGGSSSGDDGGRSSSGSSPRPLAVRCRLNGSTPAAMVHKRKPRAAASLASGTAVVAAAAAAVGVSELAGAGVEAHANIAAVTQGVWQPAAANMLAQHQQQERMEGDGDGPICLLDSD